MIRAYHERDAHYLAPIHTGVFPNDPLSPTAFRSMVSTMLAYGGKAWTIVADSPIGYALAVPVPGLPHIADLTCCIAPAWQRQGLGGRLLQRVFADLQGSSFKQLTYEVRALDSPAAQFLGKNGFFIEHEEWLMRRADLRHLPRPEQPDSETADVAAIATLPRREAATNFKRLFSDSFGGLPWDQPYSEDEIESMLTYAADILFLMVGSTPTGFAWLHLEAGDLGVIEPLGVSPAYQGRGYGRFLLLCALHELARRGATRAQIGAWRTNEAAIRLYQSLGLTHQETVTFLAYDLAS
jgi:ribosomal protein S18 acetylase RimI-like enzyme